VNFIVTRRANFIGLTKKDATVLRTWLAGFNLNQGQINEIINQVKQRL
jgi:hypothetical protein